MHFSALDYGPLYDASLVYSWSLSATPPAGHWTNPEFDKLFASAQTEFDQAKRTKALQDAGALMSEEAAGLFLYQPVQVFAMTKNVDWKPGPGLVLWYDNASKA